MEKRIGKSTEVIKIGVWGPPGSGKTNYMVMLQFADCAGWMIRPFTPETQEVYLEGTEFVRDRLQFVPPTIPGKITFMTFEFEGPKRFLQNRRFQVVLPEAAGEYYEFPKGRSELVDEMARYHAILWLIDPERIRQHQSPQDGKDHPSYRKMIQQWLFLLYGKQGGGRLQQHMAFCLTKCDLPPYTKYFEDPDGSCLQELGEDTAGAIETFCNLSKVRFFATSSIGFVPGTQTSTINMNDRAKLIYPARPIGLFEPFQWLFDVV